MKRKNTLTALLALALALTLLVGCAPKGQTQNLTAEPLKGETVADFSAGMPETMFASDGWCNGSPFNVFWKSNCVSFSDGVLHLGIQDAEGGDGWSYYGGEARTSLWYGYGDYEVCMKPAKVTGTASTFFTCTGPYDTGLDGTPNRHDEIDIEFLGKDTTGVQFNYFVDGKGGHEYWYELGFDASEDYHTYGFRWEENAITWFVDGKPVYRVERPEGELFPATSGRILANYWCGTTEAVTWMGSYTQNEATADYKWIKTNAATTDLNPKPAEPSEDPAEPVNVSVDWNAVAAVNPAFESTNGKHEIAVEGEAMTVKYADMVCDWSNIFMSVADAAQGANALHLKIRNNDTSDQHVVRIDLLENGKCVNTSATWNGSAIFTDLEWGGSFVDNLPAGEEAEIVISFNGNPDSLVIMLDSTHQNDETAYAGDFTISEIKFAAGAAGEQPEAPAAGSLVVNDTSVSFTGNTAEYAPTYEDNALTVNYNEIAGNSYLNLYADCAAFVGENNLFTAAVANNGAEPVTLRVDIASNTKVNNTEAANVSATQDGVEVYTDLEWGGSTFTVQPGETARIEVLFDAAREAKGLLLYFDSSVYDDAGTHSGSVTVSDLAFSAR